MSSRIGVEELDQDLLPGDDEQIVVSIVVEVASPQRQSGALLLERDLELAAVLPAHAVDAAVK